MEMATSHLLLVDVGCGQDNTYICRPHTAVHARATHIQRGAQCDYFLAHPSEFRDKFKMRVHLDFNRHSFKSRLTQAMMPLPTPGSSS